MSVSKSTMDGSTSNTFTHTIVSEKNIFKVYAIDKYLGKTKDFIENEYEEFELKDMKKLLKTDSGYHMRILKNSSYILFGDCDYYKDNDPVKFFNLFIGFFK